VDLSTAGLINHIRLILEYNTWNISQIHFFVTETVYTIAYNTVIVHEFETRDMESYRHLDNILFVALLNYIKLNVISYDD